MAAVWRLMVVTMTGKTAAGIVTVVMAARRQRRCELWAVRCTFLIVLRHAPLAQRPSDQVNQHMAGIWTEMETGLVANNQMPSSCDHDCFVRDRKNHHKNLIV